MQTNVTVVLDKGDRITTGLVNTNNSNEIQLNLGSSVAVFIPVSRLKELIDHLEAAESQLYHTEETVASVRLKRFVETTDGVDLVAIAQRLLKNGTEVRK